MKRIIAVLALIALLVSFTGVPVSAAAINPLHLQAVEIRIRCGRCRWPCPKGRNLWRRPLWMRR